MRPTARLAAAALAATLALAVAAPLQSARCAVVSARECPMMKGATGALCHRGGATMAPAMSCCKTQGTPSPAPAGERPAPAAPLAVLPGSTLLVNVTNNAWFGDSSAPHQQLQMARFRALEAGRFLFRATSNGITAVIGPDGAIVDRIPQFVPGILKSSVVPRTGLTPYARTGNWPILSFAFLVLVAFAIARLRARHNS